MFVQRESVEVTKFSAKLFTETLIELLLNSEFNRGDGTVCVVEDLKHNEEQNILTINLSDSSSFNIKIK